MTIFPTDPAAETGRSRDRRGLWLAVAGLVVLLAALYVGGHFLLGQRLPVGTRVAGISVGGMDPVDARSKLRDELGACADRPIRLVSGKRQFSIDPQDAGLSYDVDSTVRIAGGGSTWNPWRMIETLVSGDDVDPVVNAEPTALTREVAKIAAAVDAPVVEPQVTFKGTRPVVRHPAPGRAVDTEATAALVTGQYLRQHTPAAVEVDKVAPRVGPSAVRTAVRELARPAMSAPVRINVGKKVVMLSPSSYAQALTVVVRGGQLVPIIDPRELEKPLGSAVDATEGLRKKARDATVRIKDGRPVVVPGRTGIGISATDVAAELVPVLARSGRRRSLSVDPRKVPPDVTTKDVRRLGITEKVSSFTTRFPYAEYRNTNQGRAAELIDGTILAPGDTFSFNDTVGERTRANGFTVGTIISEGVFREELGGGVSQVATTTYNAAFFAGLKDVEHHPHSFYIDRYPMGREATVAWPSIDLRFTNDTRYGVLIDARVIPSTPSREGVMTVSMWSTKVWAIKAGLSKRTNFRQPGRQYDASKRCVPQTGVEGFDVTVYRTFLKDGRRVRRESIPASYAAADTVLCQAKPTG